MGDRSPLFRWGEVVLHGGQSSSFKIDCDALTDADWICLAHLIAARVGPFGAVEGVPTGGIKLAAALEGLKSSGPLLIVDDVLTTGASLDAQRAGRLAHGAVVFARSMPPTWVMALFTLSHE